MIFLCHAIAKISVSEGVFRKKKLRSQPVTAQFAFYDMVIYLTHHLKTA